MPRTAKPQRTDITAGTHKLPVVAAPSAAYGARTKQEAAQKVVPMASGDLNAGTPAPAGGAPVEPNHPSALPVAPGELTPLTAPTARPGEPVTHGLPTGPGAGPEALGQPMIDQPIEQLRALYQQTGLAELRALLEHAGG